MSKLPSGMDRAALPLITAMTFSSLLACTVEPVEYQVVPPTEVAINVEDVEQIPIQEVSARERAARRARSCGGSNRSRIGCDSDNGVEVEQIFGPYDGF